MAPAVIRVYKYFDSFSAWTVFRRQILTCKGGPRGYHVSNRFLAFHLTFKQKFEGALKPLNWNMLGLKVQKCKNFFFQHIVVGPGSETHLNPYATIFQTIFHSFEAGIASGFRTNFFMEQI